MTPKDFVLKESVPLSRLTTFKTGGCATVLFPQNIAASKVLFPLLVRENIPYFLLGNGSNVIAKDEGYDGVIFSLSQMKEVSVQGEEVTALAGVSITHLATVAQKNSLSGMEFFYGIPGSVGGAVFMNAGAYGGECKDILKSVTFLKQTGEVLTLPPEDLEVGYRTSAFQNSGDVILSATFSLKKGNADAIRETMEELMRRRVEKQPLEYPSAGSTFKRYEGRYTAKMIEEAGLKGFSVGGAKVSEKHAGFVINTGSATSQDILTLISHVQKVIWEKEKIRIEREIRVIE